MGESPVSFEDTQRAYNLMSEAFRLLSDIYIEFCSTNPFLHFITWRRLYLEHRAVGILYMRLGRNYRETCDLFEKERVK